VKAKQNKAAPLWLKVEPGNREQALQKAAGVIRSGGAAAFPTETFYGLAVNIADAGAINRLFAIKRRPAGRPILLLLPSLSDLEQYAGQVSPLARKLIKRFWPGKLTLVFAAGRNISPLLTAGTGKIGLRLSSHPLASGLAQACGRPITGTSANISGQPACRDAQAVFDSLGAEIDLILDAGRTKGGRGSTVLDMTVDPPLILREGQIERSQIEEACA
jgi:L-threonylcarbamoyladenylate synthase